MTTTAPDGARIANDNLRHAYVKLAERSPGGGTRRFGGVVAASSRLPVGMFNRVFVFEPTDGDGLGEAVRWMTEREDPFEVSVAASALDAAEATLTDFGLVRSDQVLPGMLLASLDAVPPPAPGVTFTRVAADAAGLEDYLGVASAVFPMPIEVHRRLHGAVADDDEVVTIVGAVQGRPAACGLLIRDGATAGVYSVGVAEGHRRRGLGGATTWEVLRAGREAGCRVGVLQASPLGHRLYERMGFETVVAYHEFTPAVDA